jgi:hypothetical protein
VKSKNYKAPHYVTFFIPPITSPFLHIIIIITITITTTTKFKNCAQESVSIPLQPPLDSPTFHKPSNIPSSSWTILQNSVGYGILSVF